MADVSINEVVDEVIEARRARLREDVTADPVYARRILECFGLGVAASASDEEMSTARGIKLRRELGLQDDADDATVKETRRRRAEEEARYLRNRDLG